MFKNRKEAGQLLAEALSQYHKKKDTLILAIPRGGVVVAYEVKGTAGEARAAGEVIVSAGGVQSPQVLELSGIGQG